MASSSSKFEFSLRLALNNDPLYYEAFRSEDLRRNPPSLLMSYVYVNRFLKEYPRLVVRDWVLDSGAFSAKHSGTEIKLQDYIEFCLKIMDSEHPPAEIFALDVIGDHKSTLQNVKAMWKAGVPAIPCYHINEPDDVLKRYSREYPKIAVGGMSQLHGAKKKDFAEQCFARAWPALIHGFGVTTLSIVKSLPWHSVDSTTWSAPRRFGRYPHFGTVKVTIAHKDVKVLPQIKYFLKIEKFCRASFGATLNTVKSDYEPLTNEKSNRTRKRGH